jgi:hypothetical protein
MTDVNIEDHLSADEMKAIAADAFAAHCAEKFRTDHERIFGNIAYQMVWDEVDKVIDGDAAEIIAQRVAEVIPKISEFTVFRRKGIYEKQDSPGSIELKAAVERHRGAIGERVACLAGEITKQDLLEAIQDSKFNFKMSLT